MTKSRPTDSTGQLPQIIPVFPLSGVLLLPRGRLPLNVFEPRYLAMVDTALAGDRIIGIIQPDADAPDGPAPPLRTVGCAGRVSSFSETEDGRYTIALTGICRFSVLEEIETSTSFRLCRVTAAPFSKDFFVSGEIDVDREGLLEALRAYLEANDLEADWDNVESASNEALVNAMAMIAPYGPAEKQALLEAPDLKTRAETLIALTEVALVHEASGRRLQ